MQAAGHDRRHHADVAQRYRVWSVWPRNGVEDLRAAAHHVLHRPVVKVHARQSQRQALATHVAPHTKQLRGIM